MFRLTDRPDMTLDVYRGRKTTMQLQQLILHVSFVALTFAGLGRRSLSSSAVDFCINYLSRDQVEANA